MTKLLEFKNLSALNTIKKNSKKNNVDVEDSFFSADIYGSWVINGFMDVDKCPVFCVYEKIANSDEYIQMYDLLENELIPCIQFVLLNGKFDFDEFEEFKSAKSPDKLPLECYICKKTFYVQKKQL